MSLLFDSKRSLDRALDAVLGHELRKLNTHLPKQRRSLTELLKIKDPTVEAEDGSAIVLKRSELEELARIVPAEYQDRLKLPIIIMRRMDFGRSIYTVSGERVEEFTVKKILGLTNDEYYQMYKDQEPAHLYRPQVTELLRKFHSIFVIAFGIPKELADYGPSLP
jgi:uncharacterized protein (UPF0216 family)